MKPDLQRGRETDRVLTRALFCLGWPFFCPCLVWGKTGRDCLIVRPKAPNNGSDQQSNSPNSHAFTDLPKPYFLMLRGFKTNVDNISTLDSLVWFWLDHRKRAENACCANLTGNRTSGESACKYHRVHTVMGWFQRVY